MIVLLPIVPVLAQQQPQGSVPAPANPASGSAAPTPVPAVQPGQLPAPAAPAPQSAAPATAPANATQGLKVVALAGKGEMNDLERRVMAPLVIEVLDQDDRPVENAEVTFRFPLTGASAAFPGKTSQTVRTNGQGQAAAMNWVANNQTGSFEVHVTAAYGNQVGEINVPMSNVTRIVDEGKKTTTKQGGWWSPTWVKATIIGAAVAVAAGVFLATRGGGSTAASAPPITITPGAPTIGGPH